ncbi:MAG TPA: CvpA family protein [Ktedonobacteraceae bacterium]
MPGSLSIVDVLFLVTIVLLVLSGFRNGFVFSLINLLSLPVAAVAALVFGPTLTALLARNGLAINPLISYIILFLVAVVVIHMVATAVRGTIKSIPLLGSGDALLGGVIGFVEAWALWVVFLLVLGHFLNLVDQNQIQQLGFHVDTFHGWQQFYNDAVSNSLFARVNGWFIRVVPMVPSV